MITLLAIPAALAASFVVAVVVGHCLDTGMGPDPIEREKEGR